MKEKNKKEEEIIKKKLNNIYKEITGRSLHWNSIDFYKYEKEFEKLFYSNKIFKELNKKYKMEDIDINKLIIQKHILLYIFFEKLYNKILSSEKIKKKVFDYKCNDNKNTSIFLIIKRNTLVLLNYISNISKYSLVKNNKFLSGLYFNIGVNVNIFEAVIQDIFFTHNLSNVFVGLVLMLTLPFSTNYVDDLHRHISTKWVDLYTSWNYNFIYNNGPGDKCFPMAGICLINAQKHNLKNNLWVNNRLYTLYLSTIIESTGIFHLNKEINNKFLSNWNKLNIKNIFDNI